RLNSRSTGRNRVAGVPPSLVSMLGPRSVAVVGASAREGSFGWEMMRQLRIGGFEGAVHPVNPSYDDVLGYPCLPSLGSLAELAEPVDLVLLGVRNALLEEELEAAARVGA